MAVCRVYYFFLSPVSYIKENVLSKRILLLFFLFGRRKFFNLCKFTFHPPDGTMSSPTFFLKFIKIFFRCFKSFSRSFSRFFIFFETCFTCKLGFSERERVLIFQLCKFIFKFPKFRCREPFIAYFRLKLLNFVIISLFLLFKILYCFICFCLLLNGLIQSIFSVVEE